jgi:hypothetical protein
LSEDFFTRADWRPSPKRATYPRVQPYAGRKTAPPAFLAAAKFAGLNTNRAARCTRIAASTGQRCKHVAMKGSKHCMSHGGANSLNGARRARAYVPTEQAQRAQAERALGLRPPE